MIAIIAIHSLWRGSDASAWSNGVVLIGFGNRKIAAPSTECCIFDFIAITFDCLAMHTFSCHNLMWTRKAEMLGRHTARSHETGTKQEISKYEWQCGHGQVSLRRDDPSQTNNDRWFIESFSLTMANLCEEIMSDNFHNKNRVTESFTCSYVNHVVWHTCVLLDSTRWIDANQQAICATKQRTEKNVQ